MIKLRKSTERGHFDHGWLKTYHSFSFAGYHDPAHRGFRSLRVINEDVIEPGKGFATHSHRDMEIVTYILSGSLQHKDNMGNTSVIRPDEVQRMSAGTGVTHSEFNASEKEPAHLLQIWILPAQKGLKPGYQQMAFAAKGRKNRLRLVAAGDGGKSVVRVHQNLRLYDGELRAGTKLLFQPPPGRGTWIQLVAGTLQVNGTSLSAGDGCAVEEEKILDLETEDSGRFLLFDLA